ncbi:hypothetical protein Barb6_03727 [Bacteroidales bacterium Barb6]|nr:hypothetical protein Barb6_03727 [Bacteroidales bacterium Barb6]
MMEPKRIEVSNPKFFDKKKTIIVSLAIMVSITLIFITIFFMFENTSFASIGTAIAGVCHAHPSTGA